MEREISNPRLGGPIQSERVAAKRRRLREQLIATGAELFVRRGMAKVSVEDVIEAACTSRTTFYGLFANKAELAAAALNPVFREGAERFSALRLELPENIVPGIINLYLELWARYKSALLLINVADATVFPNIEIAHMDYVSSLLKALEVVETAGLLRNGSAEYSRAIVAKTGISLLRIYQGHPDWETLYRGSMADLLLASSGRNNVPLKKT